MNIDLLKDTIEGIDIYILDQILKDRFKKGGKLLDAGCGNGRNLKWFYNTGFEVYGTDLDVDKIELCKLNYPRLKDKFLVTRIEEMPYKANYFDAIICNAVLHFAKDLNHFYEMFHNLLRIIKPKGVLFIRVASNFGIEQQVEFIKNGVYKLPDGSTRFLLTPDILNDLKLLKNISFIETVKTTIVENKRSMTTLVLQKLK